MYIFIAIAKFVTQILTPKARPDSWPMNHLLIATCLQIISVFLPIPYTNRPINAKIYTKSLVPEINVAIIKIVCPNTKMTENMIKDLLRPILSIK